MTNALRRKRPTERATPRRRGSNNRGLEYGKMPDRSRIQEWDPTITVTTRPALESSRDLLGRMTLAAGEHELKLECLGKNSQSPGYSAAVDALVIEDISSYRVTATQEEPPKGK